MRSKSVSLSKIETLPSRTQPSAHADSGKNRSMEISTAMAGIGVISAQNKRQKKISLKCMNVPPQGVRRVNRSILSYLKHTPRRYPSIALACRILAEMFRPLTQDALHSGQSRHADADAASGTSR